MNVYFEDDLINIVYKNKVIKRQFKSVSNGLVFDKNKFVFEFSNLVKEEKIKSKLFGDKISVVKNTFFSVRDIYFLESVFQELGFTKVDFLDIRDFFLIDDATYIEISKNGFAVSFIDNGVYFDRRYFQNVEQTVKLFLDCTKKTIVLFGNSDEIPLLSINGKNVYYFDEYKNYITRSLLKVNKN